MAESNSPYEPDHVADPVTKDAVAAAMAATDTPVRRVGPWFERFFVAIIAFVLVAGTFGAITGAIATYNNHVVNSKLKINQQQLKATQDCIVKLTQEAQVDAAVRSAIAADDRNAQLAYDIAISTAKNNDDLRKAVATLEAQTIINNKNRAQYEVKIPDISSCSFKALPIPKPRAAVLPTPKSSSESVKKSSTSSPNHPSHGVPFTVTATANGSTQTKKITTTVTVTSHPSPPSSSPAAIPNLNQLATQLENQVQVPVNGILCSLTKAC